MQELDADFATDVLIVGGGFLGLSAALHLSACGVKVAVLEAMQIGWGASGRTGGQVIAGLKFDPDELEARYPDRADGLIRLSGEAPRAVYDLVEKYGIQCDLSKGGWLQPGHSSAAMDTLELRRRQWEKRGLKSRILDRQETAKALGCDAYQGAWLDPRGGNIHPLSYCHGLAGSAIGLGATIFEQARVEQLVRNGARWEAVTSVGHKVVADQVLVCTNAYSDGLIRGVKGSILAANSFQIATHPLPPSIGSAILPSGMAASDTRKLLLYFRRDAQGRFILGGRGPFDASKPGAYKTITMALHRLYPQLANEKLEFSWNGKVALTADFLPHYHTPAPGLHVAVGFNGRGVALTSAMGLEIGEIILGRGTAEKHPLHAPAVRQIPFPFLKRLYIQSAVAYYRFRDSVG